MTPRRPARRFLRLRQAALLSVAAACALTTAFQPADAAEPAPTLQVRTFANGLRAVIQERPWSRVSAISVGIAGGSRHEDPSTVGAAHFMEHMYFQGTPRRPSVAIAQQDLEAVGGWNNAWTSTESINFQIMVPAEAFDLGLDILSDSLVNALFPAEQLERERRVVIEELNGSRNTPWRYGLELLQRQVLAGHPAAQLPAGSRETVQSISRDTILKFRDEHFVAANMVVAVVGNVQAAEVFPKLEAAFANMRQGPVPTSLPSAPPPPKPGLTTVDMPIQQAQISLGIPVVGENSPDRSPLEVAANLLGDGGQRLRRTLVDEEEAASGVGTAYWQFSDVGVWVAVASADPKDADRAIALVRGELAKLREAAPDDEEVAASIGNLVGSARLAREGSMAEAVSIADGYVTNTYETLEEYVDRISRVTPADVQRVARQYLDPAQLTIVEVRPRPNG
ncbi:MAG: insulinase family protein [Chloroflexi bacterium]|nr:insulinase family protein [Chloroflexota bacterium]